MLAAVDPVTVVKSGVVLLGIGLVFVIILSAAYARLKVEQDPTVEAVLNVLPGVNCGGCGLAGCSAYAEAVVANHGLMGKCGPGGEALVKQIAGILGIEAAASAPIRPVVHCSAHTGDRTDPAHYQGIRSCQEAQMVAGAMGCPYGCLGYGDCEAACEFDAIHVVDGLAEVNYDKCVGCAACEKACPRQLIEMLPLQADPLLVVACASLDKAKDVRSYCAVGCVGCTLCAKMAPNLFQMKQNLAVIDYDRYGPREEIDKATGKCPRQLLVYVGKGSRPRSSKPETAAATQA